jgi:hypothetical protein
LPFISGSPEVVWKPFVKANVLKRFPCFFFDQATWG